MPLRSIIFVSLLMMSSSVGLHAHASAAASATPSDAEVKQVAATASTHAILNTEELKQAADAHNLLKVHEDTEAYNLLQAITKPSVEHAKTIVAWLEDNPQKNKDAVVIVKTYGTIGDLELPQEEPILTTLMGRISYWSWDRYNLSKQFLPIIERLIQLEPTLRVDANGRSKTLEHTLERVVYENGELSPAALNILRQLIRLAYRQGVSLDIIEKKQRSEIAPYRNTNHPRIRKKIEIRQTILDEIAAIRQELLEAQAAAELLHGTLPRELISVTQDYITDLPIKKKGTSK